jgi:PAS domain-containing protein
MSRKFQQAPPEDVVGKSPASSLQLSAVMADKTLRLRAEAIFRENADRDSVRLETLSQQNPNQLLEELQVHQIELEIQNEDLRKSQESLDATRARYFDLYDLAPVGYFTLSEQGLIRQANLTVTNLFGVDRAALINRPISRFILTEDQANYYLHRKSCLRAVILKPASVAC